MTSELAVDISAAVFLLLLQSGLYYYHIEILARQCPYYTAFKQIVFYRLVQSFRDIIRHFNLGISFIVSTHLKRYFEVTTRNPSSAYTFAFPSKALARSSYELYINIFYLVRYYPHTHYWLVLKFMAFHFKCYTIPTCQ